MRRRQMTCGCDFHPTMIAAGRLLASRRSARPAWKRRESIASSRTGPRPTCRSRLPAPYRVFRRIRTSTRIYSPRYSRRGAVSGCGASGDGAGFRVFRHGDICELRYHPPGSMFPHRAPGWMDPHPLHTWRWGSKMPGYQLTILEFHPESAPMRAIQHDTVSIEVAHACAECRTLGTIWNATVDPVVSGR